MVLISPFDLPSFLKKKREDMLGSQEHSYKENERQRAGVLVYNMLLYGHWEWKRTFCFLGLMIIACMFMCNLETICYIVIILSICFELLVDVILLCIAV